MRFLQSIFIITLFTFKINAQIGIGVNQPTAALEVTSKDNGIAALRLTPQTNPLGTDTGQLSVIGERLYMFDKNRDKWLSIEYTTMEFGRLGQNSDNPSLEFAGDVQDSGPILPLDGTIVKVAMQARRNDTNKGVKILINDTPVSDNNVDSSKDGVLNFDNNLQFVSENYNVDFNAGDSIRLEIEGTGTDVQDLCVVLFVKWRQENPN